ncbi:MAG: VOC family protein [Dehalococcoidia bacterium]
MDLVQNRAKVLVYIEVDDPAAYLGKVKAAGGEVVQDVTVIPDMVTYATFRDPAGNEVGIVKAQPR